MTTKLSKSVARISDEYIRDTGKLRPLIVTLYPSGYIGLRPKGTRREELYPLANVYSIAVKARVAAEKAEKKAARKARARS